MLQRLFGYEGRIRRSDWWVWTIVLVLIRICVASAIIAVIDPGHLDPSRPFGSAARAVGRLPLDALVPFELLYLWPVTALGVKRLHDRGLPGWPIIALDLFAMIFSFVIKAAPSTYDDLMSDSVVAALVAMVVLLIYCALSLWFLVMLGFMDGTKGPNRFGPSPKGIEDAQLATFD